MRYYALDWFETLQVQLDVYSQQPALPAEERPLADPSFRL